MRKFLTFTLAILFLSTVVSAQTLGTELLYQKYKGEEGIISIWLPGIAMKLAASIADLDEEEDDLLRSIRSLRVLTIEDNSLYPDVNFAKEVKIKPGKNGYQVLIEVSDGNEDVLILGKEKKGKLKDILILVGGDDNVMVHIKGRMNTDMIESIAQVAGLDQVDLLSNL
jgi:hypothetical protein